MKQARRFQFYGRVQGVGFRYRASALAETLGLTGWVRNRPDGSVESVGEGDPEQLDAFAERARLFPSPVRVDRVETEACASEGSSRFEIRHG